MSNIRETVRETALLIAKEAGIKHEKILINSIPNTSYQPGSPFPQVSETIVKRWVVGSAEEFNIEQVILDGKNGKKKIADLYRVTLATQDFFPLVEVKEQASWGNRFKILFGEAGEVKELSVPSPETVNFAKTETGTRLKFTDMEIKIPSFDQIILRVKMKKPAIDIS